MAVTNADILGWLNENPNADDTLIAKTMQEAGVTPAQMAEATGLNYGNVSSRYEAALGIASLPSVTAPKVDTPTFTETITSGTPTTQEELLTTLAGTPTTNTANTTTATDWPTIIYNTTDGEGGGQATTTSDGTPFYLRDADEGGHYQNPNTVETYVPFTGTDGQTYYAVHAPVFSTGVASDKTPVTGVMTEAQFRAFQGGSSFGDMFMNMVNSPVGSFALGMLGPLGQAINAVNQASQENYLGAILSGTNAAQGFGVPDIGGFDIKDVQNVARGLNAIKKDDLMGALTAGSNLFGGVPGDYTTVSNLASATLSLKNNDTAGFLSAVGNLTGSADAKTAAAATKLLTAISADNPNIASIQAAANGLTTAVGNSSKNVKTAGLDEDTVPGGLQLASLGDGVFRTDIGGAPIFAESKNAGSVKAPFGYELMSTSQADDRPAGSFYDPTTNAWFMPSTELTDFAGSSSLQSDIDLFKSSIGDLDQIADSTSSTSDDYMADFLQSIGITNTDQLQDSNLSNKDILDLIGLAGDDVSELFVTDKKEDIPELVIADKKDDISELVVTDKKEDIPEIVVTDKKDDTIVTDGTDDKVDDTIVTDDTEDKVDDTKTLTCPEGFTLSADGKSCVPIVKPPPPPPPPPPPVVTKPVLPEYSIQPGSQTTMPSQDPYAKIKLMEELFGTDIAYKLLGIDEKAGKSLGAGDLNALLKLLGSK